MIARFRNAWLALLGRPAEADYYIVVFGPPGEVTYICGPASVLAATEAMTGRPYEAPGIGLHGYKISVVRDPRQSQ